MVFLAFCLLMSLPLGILLYFAIFEWPQKVREKQDQKSYEQRRAYEKAKRAREEVALKDEYESERKRRYDTLPPRAKWLVEKHQPRDPNNPKNCIMLTLDNRHWRWYDSEGNEQKLNFEEGWYHENGSRHSFDFTEYDPIAIQEAAEKEKARETREHFEVLTKQRRKEVKPEINKMIFPILGVLFLVGACVFGLGSSLLEKNMYGSYSSSGYSLNTTPIEKEEEDESSSSDAGSASFDKYTHAAPPEYLKEELPYVGMPSSWIFSTGLGECDDLKVVTDKESEFHGLISYIWKSENTRDDVVFVAYEDDSEIIAVEKHHPGSRYWPEDSVLPDLDARKPFVVAGEKYSSQAPVVTLKPDYYDPMDYDSPEEYADDAEAWFKSEGYKDPWNAAYEHWEESY